MGSSLEFIQLSSRPNLWEGAPNRRSQKQQARSWHCSGLRSGQVASQPHKRLCARLEDDALYTHYEPWRSKLYKCWAYGPRVEVTKNTFPMAVPDWNDLLRFADMIIDEDKGGRAAHLVRIHYALWLNGKAILQAQAILLRKILALQRNRTTLNYFNIYFSKRPELRISFQTRLLSAICQKFHNTHLQRHDILKHSFCQISIDVPLQYIGAVMMKINYKDVFSQPIDLG